jgi:hypothetical protein
MKYAQRFTYKNQAEVAFRLTVEPWADQYLIEPGQSVDLIMRSDTPECYVTFEQHADGLTAWAEVAGSIIDVMSD